MAQGIRPDEKPNARDVYADIIDLPHWEPGRKHPRMSLHDRAAQFAPFAALSGYEEMVEDEARRTDREIEPNEEQKEQLNEKLNLICDVIEDGTRPEVSVTYFVPDRTKAGGRYDTVTARIKKVDSYGRKIILDNRDRPEIPEAVPFDRILEIHGELVDYMDDSF